jgi:hypothetical protein
LEICFGTWAKDCRRLQRVCRAGGDSLLWLKS